MRKILFLFIDEETKAQGVKLLSSDTEQVYGRNQSLSWLIILSKIILLICLFYLSIYPKPMFLIALVVLSPLWAPESSGGSLKKTLLLASLGEILNWPELGLKNPVEAVSSCRESSGDLVKSTDSQEIGIDGAWGSACLMGSWVVPLLLVLVS